MRRESRSIVLLIAAALAGCAGNREQGSLPACEAVTGDLQPGATAVGLDGRYRLTVVATSGRSSGRRAVGRLWLRPHAPELQYVVGADGEPVPGVRFPVFGWTDVDLAPLGAVPTGDLLSEDPLRPGVIVSERQAAGPGEGPSIVARLGDLANQRDVVRFDGAYTALYVRAIDERSFAGGWASGVTGREASGYFCAVREG